MSTTFDEKLARCLNGIESARKAAVATAITTLRSALTTELDAYHCKPVVYARLEVGLLDLANGLRAEMRIRGSTIVHSLVTEAGDELVTEARDVLVCEF